MICTVNVSQIFHFDWRMRMYVDFSWLDNRKAIYLSAKFELSKEQCVKRVHRDPESLHFLLLLSLHKRPKRKSVKNSSKEFSILYEGVLFPFKDRVERNVLSLIFCLVFLLLIGVILLISFSWDHRYVKNMNLLK